MNASVDAPKVAAPDTRLRLAIIAIAVLALIQVSRIMAYPLAQDVLAGRESIAWLYPAYVDMFVGVTAPFVAFGIWRRTGLGVWTAAIVWFTISILDHLDAVTAALHTTGPLPAVFGGGSPSQTAIFLLVASAIEGVAILSLARGKLKSHYLGSLGSAD